METRGEIKRAIDARLFSTEMNCQTVFSDSKNQLWRFGFETRQGRRTGPGTCYPTKFFYCAAGHVLMLLS